MVRAFDRVLRLCCNWVSWNYTRNSVSCGLGALPSILGARRRRHKKPKAAHGRDPRSRPRGRRCPGGAFVRGHAAVQAASPVYQQDGTRGQKARAFGLDSTGRRHVQLRVSKTDSPEPIKTAPLRSQAEQRTYPHRKYCRVQHRACRREPERVRSCFARTRQH